MNNKSAEELINDCILELEQIEKIIEGLGIFSNMNLPPY